jgi:acetyl-CoA carboxylase biotin carboxyl carrier protein
MKINKETIKELSEYLNEFNLTEIEYTDKDTKIKVSKTSAAVTTAAAPIQTISATKNPKEDISNQQSISGTKISSPIIGTAYHAPEPGAKKFVEIGKKIKKGDTVMIVEAMKTMNHVPSTADGVVKEICVKDGQPVEFGQTIIIVE